MLKREKNKISYLHFILSVLVILVHSINDETTYQRLFSIENGIGQFAVPLFFMISGFLYFINIHDIQDVSRKITKRIATVLYPFLIWNIIYYIVNLLVKGGHEFSIIELFDVAFNYTYNPAFWFMFQLILLIAISPLIYYALRKYKYYAIFFAIISSLILLNIDIPYINEDAIIYFSFGGVFAKLYNDNKVFFIDKKNTIYTLFIFIFMFLVNRIAYSMCMIDMKYVSLFTLTIVYVRLSVAFFIFYFVDLLFKYDKVVFFMHDTFFLYAIHYMIVKGLIVLMRYIIYAFIDPKYWDMIKYFTFIISPVVCVCVCHILSKILKDKVPKFYAIITGNRI